MEQDPNMLPTPVTPGESDIKVSSGVEHAYKQIYDFHTAISAIIGGIFGCGLLRAVQYEYASESGTTVVVLWLVLALLPATCTALLGTYVRLPFTRRESIIRGSVVFGSCRLLLLLVAQWRSEVRALYVAGVAVTAVLWALQVALGLGFAFAFRRMDHWALYASASLAFDLSLRAGAAGGAEPPDLLGQRTPGGLFFNTLLTLAMYRGLVATVRNWDTFRRADMQMLTGFHDDKQKNLSAIFGVAGRKPYTGPLPPFHYAQGTEPGTIPALHVALYLLVLCVHVSITGNSERLLLSAPRCSRSAQVWAVAGSIGGVASAAALRVLCKRAALERSRAARGALAAALGLCAAAALCWEWQVAEGDASSGRRARPVHVAALAVAQMLVPGLLVPLLLGFAAKPAGVPPALPAGDTGSLTEPAFEVPPLAHRTAAAWLCAATLLLPGSVRPLVYVIVTGVIGLLSAGMFAMAYERPAGAVRAPDRGDVRHPFWLSIAAVVFTLTTLLRIRFDDI